MDKRTLRELHDVGDEACRSFPKNVKAALAPAHEGGSVSEHRRAQAAFIGRWRDS